MGSVLFYARAIDDLLLPSCNALSCCQSAPTEDTMVAVDRLLGYAAKFPNAHLDFYPSDMLLRIESDASFLSRPKSGSVVGGFHYLGRHDPAFRNAPIICISSLIPVIVAAVSEAEYAGVFGNAQVGVDSRSILKSLGYPQPPTPILCDNECAVGLSNKTIRPQMSKSIDMRLNWIQDRVKQRQFDVIHVKGVDNLADYFTKSLPLDRHLALQPFYVSYH